MLSQAEIMNPEDTTETEDNSIYIEAEKKIEHIKHPLESEALKKTLYLQIESRKFFSSEVREKQVGW